jgi:hypothetical protein
MERGTKEYYLQLIEEEQAVTLSGRSDIHCYFWPHAAGFLRSDGYLCFITSSQWLDVEYGFRLQEWILRNFEIVALLESIDEPWFVGARVATTVAVLRRQTDEAKRESNVVRFVQFQQPVREMLAHDGTIAGSVAAADNLRDEILGLTKDCITAGYRAKLVPQALLWAEGVHLGQLMAAVDGEEDERLPATGYYGGKWGVYIRAPELWFRALSRFGDRLVPLAHLATVRFGVKSGADSFFFPVDVTAECLAKQADNGDFKQEYGVERRAVAAGKVRLVKCGKSKGEIRPVEAEYLEPEVHSLMEVDAFVVPPECCSRQVLLTAKKPAHLRGTHVLEYIKWGEQLNYHKRSTCASRVSKDRTWYDLTGHARGALFWPMAQQYKHVVPSNDHNLLCNHNLFDVVPRAVDPDVLGGILNSTWVVLSKYQYGRPVGVEGNLKTEVVDVNMMRVPDPRSAPLADRARVSRAFAALKKRRPLQFLSEQRMRRMAYTQDEKASELAGLSDQSELDMQDRRELDDAVLEMLGVKTKKEREQLNRELYNYLGEFFEQTRQKEEKAIANKKRAARKGSAQPDEIAAQVMEQVQAEQPELIADYDMKFLDKTKPFDTFDLPTDGEPQCASTIFMPHGVAFMKGKKKLAEVATKYTAQDDLIVLLAQSGVRGLVRIPHAESECSALAAKYGAFVRRRDARLKELVEDRTSDEDMQEKILEAIQAMLHQ